MNILKVSRKKEKIGNLVFSIHIRIQQYIKVKGDQTFEEDDEWACTRKFIQINKAHKRLGKLPAKDFGKIGNDNEGSFGIDK
jgi:hypothetical protein